MNDQIQQLHARIAELEAQLYAIGAGGVGQSIKPPVQADTAQKPVAWQRRMRQDWVTEKDCWGPWEDCTQAQADDYKQTPVLHDQWVYESRALYTAPQAASQPLTDEQIWGNDRIMGANSKLGLLMKDLALLVRAVEQAHGIGGNHG